MEMEIKVDDRKSVEEQREPFDDLGIFRCKGNTAVSVSE